MQPAPRLIKVASCLLLAGTLALPVILHATVMQPLPPPSDPWTAVPKPSATPSDSDEDGVDSSEVSDDEADDDSPESGEADEPSRSRPD